jgi:hypothetical protein
MRPRPPRVTQSEDPGATAVLRRIAPGWAWLRDNFKLPALVTIAGLVAAGVVGYLQVINRPDLTPRLEKIEAALADIREAQASERQQLADVAGEVASQRGDWKHAAEVAGKPLEAIKPTRHKPSRP